jgi:predicted PurR-regulated permease PerM
LLLAFAALLLAILLRGTGRVLARNVGLKPVWGVVAVCCLGVGAAAATTWLLAPKIAAQASELGHALPNAVESLKSNLNQHSWGPDVLGRIDQLTEALTSRASLRKAGGLLSTTAGAVGGLLLWLFLGLFVALEPEPYRGGFLLLLSSSRRAHIADVLDDVGHVLRRWMLAKLVAMAAIGVLTWLGLTVLGVPLALSLALLAAMLSMVPNFGPVLAALPALLLAALESVHTTWLVLLLYLGIQAVESYALTPLLQRKAASLPPGVILIAQVAMGALAGGLGVVLATPLTAAAATLVKRLYVEDVLNEPAPDEQVTPSALDRG